MDLSKIEYRKDLPFDEQMALSDLGDDMLEKLKDAMVAPKKDRQPAKEAALQMWREWCGRALVNAPEELFDTKTVGTDQWGIVFMGFFQRVLTLNASERSQKSLSSTVTKQ